MATLEAPEDGYDFVERPSEDFFCPVTLDLLKEPHLTPCCGNHLSQEAVTRLQGQPCPVCKEPNPCLIMPDKFFKQKVNELQVRCPNKSLGCEWVGELGSLDRHLSQNSVEGECQFVTVACPYSCGDGVQRCQLEGHKANDCPNRPFTCQYCDHKATYIKMTIEHWPICKKYPVECEFSYAGCDIECQRQHMQDHVNENVTSHLSMVSTVTEENIEQQDSTITELQSTIEQRQKKIEEKDSTIKKMLTTIEQLQKQIVALMSALALNLQKPLAPIFVPPPDIVMTDFEEHKKAGDIWNSPPFYTHIGGYKMCLRVNANGDGEGEGTHLLPSCSLMSGEYDGQLKWPFCGDITIQLLNQRRDEGHWEGTVSFDDSVGDHVVARVVGQERACTSWGYFKFITHNELSTKDDKEYLKNDCLKFRITNAVIKST